MWAGFFLNPKSYKVLHAKSLTEVLKCLTQSEFGTVIKTVNGEWKIKILFLCECEILILENSQNLTLFQSFLFVLSVYFCLRTKKKYRNTLYILFKLIVKHKIQQQTHVMGLHNLTLIMVLLIVR